MIGRLIIELTEEGFEIKAEGKMPDPIGLLERAKFLLLSGGGEKTVIEKPNARQVALAGGKK